MSVMRYAMIKDGVVQNICLWDGDLNTWTPPEDMTVIAAPENIGVGWSYSEGQWAEPVPDIT